MRICRSSQKSRSENQSHHLRERDRLSNSNRKMISALLTRRGGEWAEPKQVTGDSPLISWLPLVMEDFWMLASDSSSVSLSTETENMVSLMVSNRRPGLSLCQCWKLLGVEEVSENISFNAQFFFVPTYRCLCVAQRPEV